jgi:hypothetical protein
LLEMSLSNISTSLFWGVSAFFGPMSNNNLCNVGNGFYNSHTEREKEWCYVVCVIINNYVHIYECECTIYLPRNYFPLIIFNFNCFFFAQNHHFCWWGFTFRWLHKNNLPINDILVWGLEIYFPLISSKKENGGEGESENLTPILTPSPCEKEAIKTENNQWKVIPRKVNRVIRIKRA